MDDPHDDTDVPSGTTDGAQMERTLPPVRLDYAGCLNRRSLGVSDVFPLGARLPAAPPRCLLSSWLSWSSWSRGEDHWGELLWLPTGEPR